ncbi:MAG: PAS domain S-box protein [Saprospiraceae bacterium]|nr:PAS domain S-box protein [Saprospiraceae bacterium]
MYHKLLQKQINKYLTPEMMTHPECKGFLESINNSYFGFERDKELSDHAFLVSEKEFETINNNLKTESNVRFKTIEKLKEIVSQLVKNEHEFDDKNKDDLLYISDFIRIQVLKNQKTEESLYRTINLFQTLLANLQSGVLVENENREILFTNQLFCNIFGIPAAPEDLIGADCTNSAEQSKSLFQEPEIFVDRISEILDQKIAVYNESLIMADGRSLERDYIPVIINGVYKGHLWQYTDVTERVNSHSQIMASEERNRLIMDSALDGIIIADSDGFIKYWNPSAVKLFGWSGSEVVGKKMSETIIPEALREAHTAGMKRFKMTGQQRILNQLLELPALNKEGHEFPIELSIISFKQNENVIYCAFVKDISERKKSENLLKAQEQKYRNIIANMNLGLLEVNNDETIVFANQSFCEMSGYPMEELIADKTSKFLISETNIDFIGQKQALRKKGNSDNYELAVRNKNGDIRWWFISGGPNYNDKGEHIGSIGIHLDITNQKKLEMDLDAARIQAIEASKAKEAFLANMSHEIRTPLNAIIGMIRELGREDLTSKQQLYLSHSETAARHLLNILNNILDISKIEAGEFDLNIKEFSLSSLISNVKSILQNRAVEKGIKFNVMVSPDISPCLLGDSTRIRQILINLLGNAIKFTDNGKINLLVEVLDEDIHTQTLKFTVSDTGVGMSEDFMTKLFSKFSQEDDNSTRRFDGTGLGMAITMEMVQLMGGHIEVQSQKNQGSVFDVIIKLPIGDPTKLYVGISENKIHNLKGVRILLVEDNDMNRYIASQSLKHFGCDVLEALNGRDAIEKLGRHKFDIILMDIQMPVMDGVEATRYIREHISKSLPIIALTANAFKKDIDQYMSIGMNDYVTKPFEENILFNTLLNHVTRKLPSEKAGSDEAKKESLYNLQKLDEISRDDVSFVHKMVIIFVEQTPLSIAEMKIALSNGDMETVSKIAHRIKPGIDNMGISSLTSVIREIEAKGKSSNPNIDKMWDLVRITEETLDKVIESLRIEYQDIFEDDSR